MIPAAAAKLLTFWFDDPTAPQSEHGQPRRIWFRKNPAFDDQVRTQFMDSYEAAHRGDCTHWMQSLHGALALVILLDQFPRNMFRGIPRSFEADAQALQIAQTAIARWETLELLPVKRMFLYYPFMHSENLAHQHQAVAFFKALTDIAPELASALEYAYRHRDIIAKFGRFPHRNAILGRPSTPAEQAFLKQPGSGF